MRVKKNIISFKKHHKGFTLVELLVASSLGLFLMAMLVQQYQLMLQTEKMVYQSYDLLDRVRLFRHSIQQELIGAVFLEHSDIPLHIQNKALKHTAVIALQDLNDAEDTKFLYLQYSVPDQSTSVYLSSGKNKEDKNVLVPGVEHWELQMTKALRFKVRFAGVPSSLQEWDFCFAIP